MSGRRLSPSRAGASGLAAAGLAIALLLPAPRPASAGVLSLCGGPPVERSALAVSYRAVDGSSRTLRLSDQEASRDCTRVVLPLAPDQVVALALLPPALADRTAEALVLQGPADAGGGFAISEIEGGDVLSTRPVAMLAPGRNLLTQWSPQVFGLEKRASLQQDDGGVTFSCLPGQNPSGFYAVESARLPPLPGLALEVTAQGDAGFVIAAADEAARKRDLPVPLMRLAASRIAQDVSVAMPAALDRVSPITWTLLCPQEGGRLRLSRLSLGDTTASSPPESRSAWAWQPQLWHDQPAALLERLAKRAINRVYITVVLREDRVVADPAALRDFIRAAAKRGIRVWAVEGDPAAVLPAEREKFRSRSAALAAFNAAAPAEARLGGVQYDIEPYLVPGFALDPGAWTGAYLDTLAVLGRAAEMPVEAAVPFWFPYDQWGDRLADAVAGVAVMDYRTQPEDIENFAIPALAWGAAHHRAVHIGLELGPLGGDERHRYQRAGSGELWRVTIGGYQALLLLRSAAENPSGTAYVQISTSKVPEAYLSFRGRESALSELLPGIVQSLAPWPSYGGIALHGLF